MTVDSPGAPSTRDDDRDPATQPLRPDASVTELLGDLAGQMSTLFRQELELAKVETRDEAKRAGKAAAMFGGAGRRCLDRAADGVDGARLAARPGPQHGAVVRHRRPVWLVVALVLAMRGRRTVADVQPLPTTTATLKEDVEWAKAQKH